MDPKTTNTLILLIGQYKTGVLHFIQSVNSHDKQANVAFSSVMQSVAIIEFVEVNTRLALDST